MKRIDDKDNIALKKKLIALQNLRCEFDRIYYSTVTLSAEGVNKLVRKISKIK